MLAPSKDSVRATGYDLRTYIRTIRGYQLSSMNSQEIRTVEDLVNAANAAGILPSELIVRAWPRRAPSAHED